MSSLDNLPPGVTDRDIEEQAGAFMDTIELTMSFEREVKHSYVYKQTAGPISESYITGLYIKKIAFNNKPPREFDLTISYGT